jgi:hypothetical protein
MERNNQNLKKGKRVLKEERQGTEENYYLGQSDNLSLQPFTRLPSTPCSLLAQGFLLLSYKSLSGLTCS